MQNFTQRRVYHKGDTYVSTMYWYAGLAEKKLTVTSNAQKEKLGELLEEMTRTPPPASYRERATGNRSYTIVDKTVNGCNYRIDNQMKLNLSDPDPRLDIQYQIESNSHAMVLVRMKPRECPSGIKVGLIDEDKIFGYFPGGAVMGFIDEALKYSADNKCHTCIEWTIVKFENVRPPSKGPYLTTRTHPHDKYMLESIIKITAKLATGEGTAFALKKGTAFALKKATAQVLKEVPGVGLGIGAALALRRLIDGDPLGAVGEVASGVASCFPGPGTAISLAIDAGLVVYDLSPDWD